MCYSERQNIVALKTIQYRWSRSHVCYVQSAVFAVMILLSKQYPETVKGTSSCHLQSNQSLEWRFKVTYWQTLHWSVMDMVPCSSVMDKLYVKKKWPSPGQIWMQWWRLWIQCITQHFWSTRIVWNKQESQEAASNAHYHPAQTIIVCFLLCTAQGLVSFVACNATEETVLLSALQEMMMRLT